MELLPIICICVSCFAIGFIVGRVTYERENDGEFEKVVNSAALYGQGFYYMTNDGIRHIENKDVLITENN